MKKLLVLMLVLGMTSLANAALVLSINGVQAPDVYNMLPSETITIDMMLTTTPEPSTNFCYDVAFVLSNPQAAFTWAGITFPTVYEFPGAIVVFPPSPSARNVEVTASQFFGSPIAAPAVLVNNLLLHCEEPTDVVLSLVVMGLTSAVDGDPGPQAGTVLDSVTIHQIPEPATMLLLGLGGLLLRRRK